MNLLPSVKNKIVLALRGAWELS